MDGAEVNTLAVGEVQPPVKEQGEQVVHMNQTSLTVSCSHLLVPQPSQPARRMPNLNPALVASLRNFAAQPSTVLSPSETLSHTPSYPRQA